MCPPLIVKSPQKTEISICPIYHWKIWTYEAKKLHLHVEAEEDLHTV